VQTKLSHSDQESFIRAKNSKKRGTKQALDKKEEKTPSKKRAIPGWETKASSSSKKKNKADIPVSQKKKVYELEEASKVIDYTPLIDKKSLRFKTSKPEGLGGINLIPYSVFGNKKITH